MITWDLSLYYWNFINIGILLQVVGDEGMLYVLFRVTDTSNMENLSDNVDFMVWLWRLL